MAVVADTLMVLLNRYVDDRPCLTVSGEAAKVQCLLQALMGYEEADLRALCGQRWNTKPDAGKASILNGIVTKAKKERKARHGKDCLLATERLRHH